ncbi:unnamed protein product [Aphanomyces euteiches]
MRRAIDQPEQTDSFLHPQPPNHPNDEIEEKSSHEEEEKGGEPLHDPNYVSVANVVARRRRNRHDPPETKNSQDMYKCFMSDETYQWIPSKSHHRRENARLFEVLDRFLVYFEAESVPFMSLDDFKKGDVEFIKRVGSSPKMNCVENAVLMVAAFLNMQLKYTQEEYDEFLKTTSFSPENGLETGETKQFIDWFMKKGFRINRSIYEKNILKDIPNMSDPIQSLVHAFIKGGPGMYLVRTKDISLMGHFWAIRFQGGQTVVVSEKPARGIVAFKEIIAQVDYVRKCVPLDKKRNR